MNYRQLRRRVNWLARRNRTASTRGGFQVFSEDQDIYQRATSARQAAKVADHLAAQNPGQTLHVWSPDAQHCYEVAASSEAEMRAVERQQDPVSKSPKQANYRSRRADVAKYDERAAGFDSDESVAIELFDWINNSQVPYNQLQSIERNMTRKMAGGNYDREMAIKGFSWAAESGAKDYAREFGGVWHEMFPKPIRLMAAEMLRDQFEAEVEANPESYERHVFKKQLPEWQKRYPRGAAASNRTKRSQPRGETMTRRPSRQRRRRLASRVERARSRENQRNQNRSADRRVARTDEKRERLQRRVATFERLLRKAERELRMAERAERRDLDERRARVSRLRDRVRRERRPYRRAESRWRRLEDPRDQAPRERRRPTRPASKREAAPKMIRRKADGKLYVRVDK